MMPGETALTWMPKEAYSTASDRVAAAQTALGQRGQRRGRAGVRGLGQVAETWH